MILGIAILALVLSLGAMALIWVLLLRVADLADKTERIGAMNGEPYQGKIGNEPKENKPDDKEHEDTLE